MSINKFWKYLTIVVLCLYLENSAESRTVKSKRNFSQLTLFEEDQMDYGDKEDCNKLPEVVLTEILGPAYNTRYMSINSPAYDDEKDPTDLNGPKRDVQYELPFYVDNEHIVELDSKPAWEAQNFDTKLYQGLRTRRHLFSELYNQQSSVEDNIEDRLSKRTKRQGRGRSRTEKPSSRPWECEAKIKWIDLGFDYFPRYLRTVECTRHSCWYGHYTCQPRSFTVKLLRRRAGQCVSGDKKQRTGVAELPGDLRELWVWEERAVNFCCDCALV